MWNQDGLVGLIRSRFIQISPDWYRLSQTYVSQLFSALHATEDVSHFENQFRNLRTEFERRENREKCRRKQNDGMFDTSGIECYSADRPD
ncbi:hypothetical protein CRE_07586 [Caenorhabditis remanei]|uniref:Uncharacterized protein n=1 Tax=Caenorhabditis remanei TaxID=31234 RepID=E3MP53_CAERE|nr:hypothetical protein CRE_07586 [Caenorhabditis remanei]